ncbi:MAG: aminotransferase class I/II-fold pyridoxal phosphate-dependent enzyme [Burkholderiaceae bacterium]|nr:aminotransferase class I/II-fold pyridoxal phosphate-dependent enzyme [Burkholderiales bacterium]MCZ8340977.1 aminotransferase class I/II-fold pyridoxal phosphate-dependent enzyme [Burkholderiaceae bacterium]
MDPSRPLHPDSLLLHADDALHDGTSLTPSIPWSATFTAADAGAFARMASEPMHPAYYTRYGNPLHRRVARIVADLEGAATGLVAASGMGAIATVAMGLLAQGDRVVAQRNHYMGTTKLLSELLARFGVHAEFVEQTDVEAFARALERPAALVMLESPTNPDCSLTDLEAVARLAHDAGAKVVVDNTFATPLNQRPLALGADLVVHSATKYLGGHHDLTAGVVVGDEATIERLWATQIVLGATLSPMDAWLLLRGLRTLAVRVRRINDSALAVARALSAHPAMESVSYPGLETHPQHALARRQMSGFGGVMGLRLRADYAATAGFVAGLRLAQHAVSLGGVDSLVVHAAAMWAGSLDDAGMALSGIEPNLVRLSVGLEHPDDLVADLTRGLDAIARPAG